MRVAMTRPADADESARMRPEMTIVLIANATPTQSATTATFAFASRQSNYLHSMPVGECSSGRNGAQPRW